MDKKQQIEEMAKDFKSYLPNAWYNDKCVNGEVYSMVKHAYEDNYRKIDDDCAVITKDELKQYKMQAVKEFAEKLKNDGSHSIILELKYITEEKIDELLKEYE